MSNFPALDIAIGLCFVYLLLSMICTTVNEMIAGWLSTRAKFLEKGVAALIQDPALKKAVYSNPLITSLSSDPNNPQPSYIPADKFATALMDELTGHEKTTNIAALRNNLANQSPAFQKAMRSILDVAKDDPEVAKKKIEEWFNEGMDRVSGWYKRNAQRNLLILGVIVTLVVNADTLHVVDVLWKDPTTRAKLVEQAKSRASSEEPPGPTVRYDDPDDPTASKIVSTSPTSALTDDEQASLSGLTGWSAEWTQKDQRGGFWMWLGWAVQQHWLGWILTAIALSLGAPFWFDLLNRIMTIRNSGKSPAEEKPKAEPPKAVAVAASQGGSQ